MEEFYTFYPAHVPIMRMAFIADITAGIGSSFSLENELTMEMLPSFHNIEII